MVAARTDVRQGPQRRMYDNDLSRGTREPGIRRSCIRLSDRFAPFT